LRFPEVSGFSRTLNKLKNDRHQWVQQSILIPYVTLFLPIVYQFYRTYKKYTLWYTIRGKIRRDNKYYSFGHLISKQNGEVLLQKCIIYYIIYKILFHLLNALDVWPIDLQFKWDICLIIRTIYYVQILPIANLFQ